MSEPTLNVMYSCTRCKTVDRKVAVRARRGVEEEVVTWMAAVQEAIGKDHSSWSPYCRSQHCDLKVPMPEGTGYIGEVRES